VTEPLNDDEKKTLRDVAFFQAFGRAVTARRIRSLLREAEKLCQSANAGEYDGVVDQIRQVEVPGDDHAFFEALGVIPEDTEYVNENDYDRLQARFAGLELEDGYAPDGMPREHPATILKKLTKGI